MNPIYSRGTRIWIKDPERVWISVSILECDDERITFQTEDGNVSFLVVDNDCLPFLRNPDNLIGSNDVTNLSYLHEPAVLNNLRVRFEDLRQIYTFCGIVLVAVNPYDELPALYGLNTMKIYRGKALGELDPHVYAVAEEAVNKMEQEKRNQSIIVSGESGAGKTVSAKHCLQYFATVCGNQKDSTEKRILASSPIMEAFGNAKTTRNNNSSRFGKYIEINLDKKIGIIGANMRTYLLEKSRVVAQAFSERNYHIFYQLCAARERMELSHLELQDAAEFCYLSGGETQQITGVDDDDSFQVTKEALSAAGFSELDQLNIFKVLASILNLGNVTIDAVGANSRQESCSIPQRDPALTKFSDLLEISDAEIRYWLCRRAIKAGTETIAKPMTKIESLSSRDALAKLMYANLFDAIVRQTNLAFKTTGAVHKFVAVLDIYGFEQFEANSFEQFCINYANEKLQQQFNLHVFKLEQEEYQKEGLEWKKIGFQDNQPCIDLIEGKVGILDLLDEECLMPKGSDETFVEKLYNKCSDSQFLKKPHLLASSTSFIIKHYADPVEYLAEGFLEKNKDTVSDEQIEVFKSSKNNFIKTLFSGAPNKGCMKPIQKQPTQNKKTVGGKFRDSLNLLTQTLHQTTPHYIRCIKPNDEKINFHFYSKRVVEQLRACGVFETIQISAAGYPSRWTYSDFYQRYRVLCLSKEIFQNDVKKTCAKLVARIIPDKDKIQVGKTKVFLRSGLVAFLERKRSEQLTFASTQIQKTVKGWIQRRKYLDILARVKIGQKVIRGYLARRQVRRLRRLRAAIILQKHIRGWIKRIQFRRIRRICLLLQCKCRGDLARKRHAKLVKEGKVVLLQAQVRGFLERSKFKTTIRNVVITQQKVRQFLARTRRNKLKAEIKSKSFYDQQQQVLSHGLENKIFSLTIKLSDKEKLIKEIVKASEEEKRLSNEKENHFADQMALRSITIKKLEEKIAEQGAALLAAKLETDTETENRKRDAQKLSDIQAEYLSEISNLKLKIAEMLQTNERELTERDDYWQKEMEDQKSRLIQEFESERATHQALMEEFHQLESNIRDSASNCSMLSVSSANDSFYSSTPKKTFVRSLNRLDHLELESSSNNTGLVVKLTQKVKELKQSQSRLEKKLAHLEPENAALKGQLTTHYKKLREDLDISNQRFHLDLACLGKLIKKNEDKTEIIGMCQSIHLHLVSRNIASKLLKNTSADPISAFQLSLMPPEKSGWLYKDANVVLEKWVGHLFRELERREDEYKEAKGDLQQQLDDVITQHNQLINMRAIQEHVLNEKATSTLEESLKLTVNTMAEEISTLMEKIEKMQRGHEQNQNLVTAAALSVVGGASPLSAIPILKQGQIFGIIEYHKDRKAEIFRSLVTELRPEQALVLSPPCLPSYLLFMMIRYNDLTMNAEELPELMKGLEDALLKVISSQYRKKRPEVLALWIANIWNLLNLLKQYSGDEKYQSGICDRQIRYCLRTFNLSEFWTILEKRLATLLVMFTKNMSQHLQPYVSSAILERDPEALGKLIHSLTSYATRLNQKFKLPQNLVFSIFRQAIYAILAEAFNTFLLRSELFNWSSGAQMLANVSRLESWVKANLVLDSSQAEAIETIFKPIMQAAALLQAHKNEEGDVSAIVNSCSNLSDYQVTWILQHFSPKDFEDRVTPDFIKQVEEKLKARTTPFNTRALLVRSQHPFSMDLTFSPSVVDFEDIKIPDDCNGLHLLLKII